MLAMQSRFRALVFGGTKISLGAWSSGGGQLNNSYKKRADPCMEDLTARPCIVTVLQLLPDWQPDSQLSLLRLGTIIFIILERKITHSPLEGEMID